MASAAKTLYLLRHAKAEEGAAGQSDQSRALAVQGLQAAHTLGAFWREQHIRPDRIICSDALRTRQTIAAALEAYGEALQVSFEPALYLASTQQLLQHIAQTAETTERLMIVGHNPDLHELCLRLAVHGDRALRQAVSRAFPPCSFAAIRLDVDKWASVAQAQGELLQFETPTSLHTVKDVKTRAL